MNRIRLCMLARNEAERMPAMAKAVGKYIDDYVVLVDDRSDDGTPDAIRAAFGDTPGRIEGLVFENFGQARNALFEAARPGLDPSDYMLLLDPDTPPSTKLPPSHSLTDPIYACDWKSGGLVWQLPILVRADADCAYVGRVHEYLVSGYAHTPLPGVEIIVGAKPANPERYAWMAEQLHIDADTNPRSAYYLAQTYRQWGQTDAAFGWYMRRAGMGDSWFEETVNAVYEAAAIVSAVDEEIAAMLWQRCIRLRPGRAEPYYQLALAANNRGRFAEGLQWAARGLAIGPTTDVLFVNRWIEREGLALEFQRAAQGHAAPPSTMGD